MHYLYGEISITFTVSEALAALPVVIINGDEADYVNYNGSTYYYSYWLIPGTPLGDTSVTITGEDNSSNSANLEVVAAFTVTEVLSVPINIGYFLAPLLFLLGIYSLRMRRSATTYQD